MQAFFKKYFMFLEISWQILRFAGKMTDILRFRKMKRNGLIGLYIGHTIKFVKTGDKILFFCYNNINFFVMYIFVVSLPLDKEFYDGY